MKPNIDTITVVALYSLIPLLIGYVILAFYLDYLKSERLKANGERVKGEVLRNKFHLSRSSSYFRPVVRFTTRAGLVVEAEYEKGAAFAIPRYSAGTAVWVAYDKDNPRDFLLLTLGNIM